MIRTKGTTSTPNIASPQANSKINRRRALTVLALGTAAAILGPEIFSSSPTTKKIWPNMTPIPDDPHLDIKGKVVRMLDQVIWDLQKEKGDIEEIKLLRDYRNDFNEHGIVDPDLPMFASILYIPEIKIRIISKEKNPLLMCRYELEIKSTTPEIKEETATDFWFGRENNYARFALTTMALKEAYTSKNKEGAYRFLNSLLEFEIFIVLNQIGKRLPLSITPRDIEDEGNFHIIARDLLKNLFNDLVRYDKARYELAQDDILLENAKKLVARYVHNEYIDFKKELLFIKQFLSWRGLTTQDLDLLRNNVPKSLQGRINYDVNRLKWCIKENGTIDEGTYKNEILKTCVNDKPVGRLNEDLFKLAVEIISAKQYEYNPSTGALERVDYSDPFNFLTDEKYYK